MTTLTSFVIPLIRTFKTNISRLWILLGLGFLLSVAITRLIVDGNWQFALVLLFTIPALIVLYRYPSLVLILWLVLMPFLVTTQTTTDRRIYWVIHRALPPLALIFILLRSLIQDNWRKLPRWGLPEFAMVGYVVVSVISIISLSEDALANLYLFYDRVVSPMCLYFILRLTIPSQKDIKRLVPVAFYLVLSQSIIGMISWIAPQDLPSPWLTLEGYRTTGSLTLPGAYTITLIFAGLLVLHAALNSKSRVIRGLYVITFMLSIYSIFISFSRASWLGAVVVLLGLVYLYPKFMLKLGLIVVPVLAILGGWLLADEINFARQRLYSAESERSAYSRVPIFYAAYRMFQVKPWMGWGYGNFDLYDRQYQDRVGDIAGDSKDHASHNLYLTVLAEQGFIGITLFLAPLFWWLIQSLRVRTRMPRDGLWSRKLLLIFWLVILNYIIINSFTNMKIVFGLGIWWITLGLIASMTRAAFTAGEPSVFAQARRAIVQSREIGYLLPGKPAGNGGSMGIGVGEALERTWMSLTNSDSFKRFAKRGSGSRFFRSQTYRKLKSTRLYITTYHQRFYTPAAFRDVRTFCLFIGHTKSGGSLLGSLLDAHPDVVLADEMDALQYVSAGFSRNQIFHILIREARREKMKGRVTARRLDSYSLLVPDQWQGRYRKLLVVGDSTAGKTTQKLAADPGVFIRINRVMGEAEVKYIHVIRNPYDSISIMTIRGHRTFENAIERYFNNCKALNEIRSQVGGSNLLPIRYEDFIQDPKTGLTNICHFVGAEASDEYLSACVSVVNKSPDMNRHQVQWDAQWIDVVKNKIDEYDFLAGYSYEN